MYTDASFTWSTTALISSGAAAAYDGEGLKTCRNLTFTIETRAVADTAVVGLEYARTSTSPFVRMGSTAYALASSGALEAQIVQLSGPVGAVRPYVISKTGSTTKIII